MSRTDAHAPLYVRIARRDLAAVPEHRCHGGVCDLPERADAAAITSASRCWWSFVYTGQNICACRLCSDPDGRRAARRRERRAARRALAAPE